MWVIGCRVRTNWKFNFDKENAWEVEPFTYPHLYKNCNDAPVFYKTKKECQKQIFGDDSGEWEYKPLKLIVKE